MRVTIVSRIFAPEPAAASFRLGALAEALIASGHQVVVLTVRPPKRIVDSRVYEYAVRRFPVLRDSQDYVRGYLPYMSFDVPLFFRLLFGRRTDLVVAEPPPTTGFSVRLAMLVRRYPYVYYAADVWSAAAGGAGVSRTAATLLRSIEKLALRGAREVLTVNEEMARSVKQLAPRTNIHVVGNGADTSVFSPIGKLHESEAYLVYAGTASEWQGAGVFIDALAVLRYELPDLRVVFVGSGSDWNVLKSKAEREGLLGSRVDFVSSLPPEEAAAWIRGAVASLASLRPESGYRSAFPTKLFASWACGTPVVFAGEGPASEFIRKNAAKCSLGEVAEYDALAVAAAIRRVWQDRRGSEEREEIAAWAHGEVSLRAVAERAVALIAEDKQDR